MSVVISAGLLSKQGHEDIEEARAEIIEALGDYAFIEVWGEQLLLADYLRPDVSRGGIKLPGSQQHEDVYQGSIGMVLAIGPLAQHVDADRFGGKAPVIGDFVYCRPQDTVMCHIRGPGSVMRKRQIEITRENDRTGEREPTGNFREEAFRDFEGWPCRWVFIRDIYGRVKFPHMIV